MNRARLKVATEAAVRGAILKPSPAAQASPAALHAENLVNYCACAIMQVSSRGGRDKPKEDNNQKMEDKNNE